LQTIITSLAHRIRTLVASLLCGILFCTSLIAAAQSSLSLNTALLEQRIAALQEGDPDAATAETLQQYVAARELLERAEAHAQTASFYVQSLTTAPAEEALIRERLDRPVTAPDIGAEIAALSPGELLTRTSLARIELGETNARLAEFDSQIAARESNAAGLRERLEEISRQLGELPAPAISLDPGAFPSLAESRSWRIAAQRIELNAERRAIEARLTSMPARYGVITAQRTEQFVAAESLAERVRAMESRATEIALSESRPDVIGIDAENPAHPAAMGLLDRDSALRAELGMLVERLAEVRQQLATVQAHARDLEEDFSRARRAVDFAAGSDTLGRVLLAYSYELSSYEVPPPERRLSREVSETVLRRIEHEKDLGSAASARTYVGDIMQAAQIDIASVDESIVANLVAFARGYRDLLREAIATNSDYIEQLTALDVASTALQRGIAEYREYLESLVLWAPTRTALWEIDLRTIPAEIAFMRSALSNFSLSVSMLALFAFAALVTLLLARPGLQHRIDALAAEVTEENPARGRHALLALLLIVLRCLPVPLIMVILAASITDSGVRIWVNLSEGLVFLALAFLALETLRMLSGSDGVGVRYLGWPNTITSEAARELNWLTRHWLPIVAVAMFTLLLASGVGDLILARIALLTTAVVLAVRLLFGIARRRKTTHTHWSRGFINKCSIVVLIVTSAIVLGVLLGRGIGVAVLISTSLATVYVVIGALILHSLATNWLQGIQRRLSDRESSLIEVETTSSTIAPPAATTDSAIIEWRAQQLINFLVFALTAITAFLIWRPWLTALDAIMDIVLLSSEVVVDGQTISSDLTLGDIVAAAIIIALTVVSTRRLPAFLELVLNGRTLLSNGVRYAIVTLAKYFVIGTGVLMALSRLGFDWAQLRWLVAALGVGIGFGLQEIVANFISGLIILFERPIRVGDIVTIGSQAGQVTRIQIRATTIRDWDGKELLVPNKEFITGQLTNWTLTDSNTRLVIPVGIAYGSDVDKAIELLENVLSQHAEVLTQPPPAVLFTGFGDSSLNLEARCFVANVMNRLVILSELHRQINKVFNENGIVIAFPQKDVHLDTPEPIRVILDKGKSG